MRVALYHPWLKEKGGAEKVVLEIAKRSSHDVTVFTKYYDAQKTFSEFSNINIEILGNNKEPKGFIDRLLRFEIGALATDVPLKDYDAFLVSTAGVGTAITVFNHDIPTISYTHTPLRVALPEFKNSYKEHIPTYLKPFYGLSVKFFSKLENLAYKYFARVIANSKITMERVKSRNLIDGSKISVINPGADVENNKSGNYEKYFLYPSRFRRYKRQDLIIESFKKAKLSGFNLKLVGSNQEEEFVEELRKQADENIQIETDVSGERWKELYQNSYAVLFAAENEDWGIVPIEAASHSKPVISVNEGGPKESIINGETGFLVESTSQAFADKMKFLANNKEKVAEMGKKARKESQKYSWKNFSKKIDKEIDQQIQN